MTALTPPTEPGTDSASTNDPTSAPPPIATPPMIAPPRAQTVPATPATEGESTTNDPGPERLRSVAARGMFALAVIYVLSALILIAVGWKTLQPLIEQGDGNVRSYLLLGLDALLLLAGNWLLKRSGIFVRQLVTGVGVAALAALIVFQLWGYLSGGLAQLDFLAFTAYEAATLAALYLVVFLGRRRPALYIAALLFPLLALVILVQIYAYVFADAGHQTQVGVVLGQLVLLLTTLAGFVLLARRSPLLAPPQPSLFRVDRVAPHLAGPSLLRPVPAKNNETQ